ncbi:DUF420 domain-containing protein [Flammeovirga yaeyamensis]|uniref:DUF420 domain-containing protein n=1 Tax=Flammeovirga yaeyamensis TaxID=367791 RepID=A0AAX1N9R2_9BACT|nr:DUF420 domain-containing protein [Flammeovirga yaeyamensis]MBB3698735.1 putative membrane protein [Flammeovirga yaeyamensis]NMF37321.1 DUF420 domain-containing protein [Flammeovirga yaeyamensis]QWG03861.1 DUF420 domain-containing protein [Flammeovirga yaeyamensis]
METLNQKLNRGPLITIGILSIAIPVVVAILLFIPQTGKLGDLDVSFLPHLNAIINGTCALTLFLGFYFIKKGNQELHRLMMFISFALGAIFLVSYVVYHFQGGHTVFGDLNADGILSDSEKATAGTSRIIYLVLLLSHIVLSAAVVPLVLLSIYFAITKRLTLHKKIVKWAYPIWEYVAVSGVLVYLMISPYYA